MSDWLKQLAKLAPTAATLLGGPFAGMAVSAIGDALGISEPTQAKIEAAFKSGQLNGDQLVAVKLAEQNLTVRLEELGVKREELAYSDIKDARGRDALFIAAGRVNWRANFLAAGAVVAFGYSLWFLFFKEFPAPNKEILIYLFGVLTKIVTDIYNFEFSSTRSSQNKTELLAKAEAIR